MCVCVFTFKLIIYIFLGSSVESTEKDIETRLTKAWTAIIGYRLYGNQTYTDKMKRSFFQAAVTSIHAYIYIYNANHVRLPDDPIR